jgi:hypothetical protein
MTVREKVARGEDARPRPIADMLGVSYSGFYGMVSRGDIKARRIGPRAIVIPNAEARRLLGMEGANA